MVGPKEGASHRAPPKYATEWTSEVDWLTVATCRLSVGIRWRRTAANAGQWLLTRPSSQTPSHAASTANKTHWAAVVKQDYTHRERERESSHYHPSNDVRRANVESTVNFDDCGALITSLMKFGSNRQLGRRWYKLFWPPAWAVHI